MALQLNFICQHYIFNFKNGLLFLEIHFHFQLGVGSRISGVGVRIPSLSFLV